MDKKVQIKAFRQYSEQWFNYLLEAQGHTCFWCRFPVVRFSKVRRWAVRVNQQRGEVVWEFRGKRLLRYIATIDHVEPLSNGGSPALENLVVACAKCNSDRNYLFQLRRAEQIKANPPTVTVVKG